VYTGLVQSESLQQPSVDFLLAYDWPYDAPFIRLLEIETRVAGLSFLPVSPDDLPRVMDNLASGRLSVFAFLDRASDTDPSFLPLEAWAAEHVPHILNPGPLRRHVWHKTNLHWEFIRAGVNTPHTIPLPSFHQNPTLDQIPDISPLGVPFSVKPDLGGGGWGVVTGARTWSDVEDVRRVLPEDDLILQQYVTPAVLEGRRGWFRVFYACDIVIPCWWDDQTHLFGHAVSIPERDRFHLGPLWDIAGVAARISQLQLFSTEIGLTPDGRFIAVDYVNDPVDLRMQPDAREGMPADVARRMALALTSRIRDLRRSAPQGAAA
jgi:hypothetical protein